MIIKPTRLLVVLGALLGGTSIASAQASAGTSQQVPECASRPDDGAFESFDCFDGEYAWFFAEPEYRERAQAAVAALRKAAKAFDEAFGKQVPRGTVVLARSPLPDVDDAIASVQGSSWSWTLDSSSWGLQDSAVAVAAQQNYERTKLDPYIRQLIPALSEAQVRDTLAMLRPLWVDLMVRDMGFLVHESTHKWFQRAYPTWKGRPPEQSPPNWMNEMVALTLEYLDNPRTHEAIVGEMIVAHLYRTQKVTPLDTLLTMPHPANAFLGGASNGVSFGEYYSQLKLLGTFLRERSQGLRVLGAIADSEAGGVKLAEWLPAHGAAYGLPESMEKFEAAWRDWLKRRVAKR